MIKKILLPAGLIAATIIGAGIFSLPYIFGKSGILTGLFYLLFGGFIFTLIHLMYADVILKTRGIHRFVGYAEIYLGKIGKWLAMLSTVIGMIFTLTIYLILSISFINLIAPNLDNFYKLLVFWLLGSLTVFWKINRLTISESLISALITFIILIIFSYGIIFAKYPASQIFNFNYLFLPYGAVLFSLSGRVAIPSVIDYFRRNSLSMDLAKPAIMLGTLIPAFLYFLFVVGITGLSPNISEDSVTGLIGQIPQFLLWLLGVLGIICIWSTYTVIDRDIRKSLQHDLNFPRTIAGLTAVFSPILLYLIGFQNFLALIGFVGGVFMGIESIFVVLLWQKTNKLLLPSAIFQKTSRLLPYVLLLVFIAGIILQVRS